MRTLRDLVKSFQFDTIIAMFTNDLPPWIVLSPVVRNWGEDPQTNISLRSVLLEPDRVTFVG